MARPDLSPGLRQLYDHLAALFTQAPQVAKDLDLPDFIFGERAEVSWNEEPTLTVTDSEAGARPSTKGSKWGSEHQDKPGKVKDTPDTGVTAPEEPDADEPETDEPETDEPETDEPTPEVPETEVTQPADPNSYISGLDTPNGFNIELHFVGDWADDVKQQMINAAEKLSDLVTGDVPDYNGVDDIRLTVSMEPIDGSGNIMGMGGYSKINPISGLPYEGFVKFDPADVSILMHYNVFDDLALHEMMHTLGFGVLWDPKGLVEEHEGSLRFIGELATKAYNSEFFDIASADPLSDRGVPVEMEGGDATAGLHWDEDTFGADTMTPWLGVTNTVSQMTLASLEDLGYQTIFDEFQYA